MNEEQDDSYDYGFDNDSDLKSEPNQLDMINSNKEWQNGLAGGTKPERPTTSKPKN